MKKVAVKYKIFTTVVAEIRLMAEAEGWFLARRKGAMPFAVHKSDVYDDKKVAEAVLEVKRKRSPLYGAKSF